MQETSALYKALLSEEHRVETRLVIGDSGVLVVKDGDAIIFGTGSNATRILVDQGGPEDAYTEREIFNLKTYRSLFSGSTPTVGNCVAGEIDVKMFKPTGQINRMAQLIPYIRLTSVDGERKSEWIRKGVFYIDTRDASQNDDGLEVLSLHGFDALAKAQADYPSSAIEYPALDTDIVREVANGLGISVDDRTFEVMTRGYRYGLPAGYSMFEVLSNIAASYAGNFVITDVGQLRLVTLTELPVETRYLITETGYVITFGGDRILV